MRYNFCEQLSRNEHWPFTQSARYRTITADILVVVTVRTTLSRLNRQAIASHIANDMRHDAGDSNIIQGFALDRFAIFSYQ